MMVAERFSLTTLPSTAHRRNLSQEVRVAWSFRSQASRAELRGLDVYDPTTGEIRSNTTDEIACWFIDTDYNEESFFVRHAYFTGADEPYKKLQRALPRRDRRGRLVNPLQHRQPLFGPPLTGKIAVKVINHYGDEVLRVYGTVGGTS